MARAFPYLSDNMLNMETDSPPPEVKVPDETLSDVSGILHDHIRSTRLVDSTLEQVLRFLRPDPFRSNMSDFVALQRIFDAPVAALAQTLAAVVSKEPLQELRPDESHVRARLEGALRALQDSRGRFDASSIYAVGEAAAIVDNVIIALA